jgi:adenosylhomocysteine nucleosidase
MLGIVVALPWELKSFTQKKVPTGGVERIAENVVAALSGVGADRAYAAGELLIARGATGLLSWGCCGALDDRLEAGTLIVPERVIAHNGENYLVDERWHRILQQRLSLLQRVVIDAMVESERILCTPEKKRALALSMGAAVSDMESAAQARLTRERGLPFAVVRTVLDGVSGTLPENILRTLDRAGDNRLGDFFSDALLHPSAWIALMRLGRQFAAARKTMKKVAAQVLDVSNDYLDAAS